MTQQLIVSHKVHSKERTQRPAQHTVNQKLRMLGIQFADIKHLAYAEQKQIIKQHYRQHAKQLHPDIPSFRGHRHMTPIRKKNGARLQRITKAYQWLMRCESFIASQATVPDLEMPLHMQRRPLMLPPGYHETRESLWYA